MGHDCRRTTIVSLQVKVLLNRDCFLLMQDWRKLGPHEDPCPVERSCHAAVCLGYGGDHPQLLVTGGKHENGAILNDIWMLDLLSGRWKEVRSLYSNECVI